MIRKPTEFAVNSYMSLMGVMQLDDLDNPLYTKGFDEANPCHIYMICSRPRIGIDLLNTVVTDDNIHFEFKIWNQENFDRFELDVRNFFEEKQVKILSAYPYNRITFKFGSDEVATKTGILLPKILGNVARPDFIDLNILYVGQSYGVNGARTAPQRLKEHSTLQNIYAAASQNNPDREIWLALFSFKQAGITKFDGVTKFKAKDRNKDKERTIRFFEQMNSGGISERQFINFTEAALIRYFSPPYNEIYKDSFPDPAHVTYTECYDLDVNLVNVEIGSFSAMNLIFFSEKVPRKKRHFAEFVLHNKEQRINMFDF